MTRTIGAPANNTAIGFQGKTVKRPCSDGDKVVAIGDVALTITVISPSDQRTIGFQGKTVITACGDGGIVSGRDIALILIFICPRRQPNHRISGQDCDNCLLRRQ